MDKIIQGLHRFHDQIFEQQRLFFEKLAQKQQTPRALFITCSDSRIDPNLITQTEPGDLFILRNAGNIIPAHGAASGGEGATIEYAVAVLGVKHIIVCGHSHCGAMKALLAQREELKALPAVRGWFAHAEATRRIVQQSCAALSPDEQHRAAIEKNVQVQLAQLRTHPAVAAALAQGTIALHGWIYVLERGEILGLDQGTGRFHPV